MEEIKMALYEFMGYCGARYSSDPELALSKEDIKTVNDFAKRISRLKARESREK